MKECLSRRINAIQPSSTLAINTQAKALQAQGKDVISLSLGEPDFATPKNICDAAIAAILAGNTKYTAEDGTPELKQATITKLKRDNGLSYTPSQIIASTGAKQSIFNLLAVILNEGDEVIIPAPYWTSYPDMTILNGGKPVIVETTQQQEYKITPQQLQQAITDRTKLFFLNSPSNPTGMIYSDQELKALADVLLKNPHVYIMSDDIYEHIVLTDKKFHNILNVCPQLFDRTVVINGASKGYAMTGWRIGVAAGPANIIAAMKKIQGQCTSNPCSISQAAAVEAFVGDQSFLQKFREVFKERHNFAYARLSKMPGFELKPAQGAFYLFPNVEQAYKKLDLQDDVAFVSYLLERAGVALVPGSAFGSAGTMRLSYALDMASLERALDRIEQSLA